MSIELPAADEVFQARIRQAVEEAGEAGLSEEELTGILPPEAPPEARAEALGTLRREGLVTRRQGGWVAAPHAGLEAGVVETREEGGALLRTGEAERRAFFLPPEKLGGALDGDRVLAVPRPPVTDGPFPELPSAAVAEVVDRRNQTVVGSVEKEGGEWILQPFDTRLDLRVEVQGGGKLEDGVFVVTSLVSDPDEGAGRARGRVVEVLGKVEVPGVDVQVVKRHYNIRDRLPAEVRGAAEALPADPGPADRKDRRDLTGLATVTIDGRDARDFDDAISVQPARGTWLELGVHIADVSHYVAEGSELDLEAYERGTSVYYPEEVVPMLPEGLSNGLCSLRPGVPRLAVSVFLTLDREGRVIDQRFEETVIASHRRLTYDEVRRVLEEPAAEDEEEYGELLPLLRRGRELMQVLNRVRMARGSLDFDLPEGDVVLDTDGHTVGIKPGERNVAHRMIEEMMIAANEAVGRRLAEAGCPALYRVHERPARESLAQLQTLLEPLDLSLEGNPDDLPPSAVQELLRQVAGEPEEAYVTAAVLRAMERAYYSPECGGHYALASPRYLHFTSPIRRYPDLVVHRQLKRLLAGTAGERSRRTGLAERLPAMATHLSRREREAERSERDLLQWKKVRFLAGRRGERFAGTITGVQPFGLFVQLDGLYVDGLVPVAKLGDDYYEYRPAHHQLVGRSTGKVYRLGTAVEVELVGVSLRHRGLDLVIVGARDRRRRRPRRRKERRR